MMNFTGKRFKTINKSGRASLVGLYKGFHEGTKYYSLKAVKVVRRDEVDDFENFRVVRQSENYCYIECEMIFLEETLLRIFGIMFTDLIKLEK